MEAASMERPSSSSTKRSRVSDSPLSGESTPVPESLKEPYDRNDLRLPAFLRQSDPDIRAKWEDLNRQQTMRFSKGRISKDPTSQWAQDTRREVCLRDRYLDMWPWANSRVRLKVPEGVCDYINASPIVLHCSETGDERKYIATQGPKDTVLSHFWQMVWDETNHVAVIVMLTQLAEGGREKCFQYYPEDLTSEELVINTTNETGEEHAGTVKLMEVYYDEPSHTWIRRILLSCGGESKTVWHLLFLGWPDHEAPKDRDRAALLELLSLSKKKNESPGSPRIVHCSAGVGRSGTFIALEHLLAELENRVVDEVKEPDDPIFDTVNKLREQRPWMVQTVMQFEFLYDTLREQFLKLQKEKQQDAAPEAEASATENLPQAGGEPSPKVMRLSKGFRRVFDKARSRSRSRFRSDDEMDRSSSKGKAPETP